MKQNLTLHVVMSHPREVLKAVEVEGLIGGTRWAPMTASTFVCKPMAPPSPLEPMPPFPNLTGSSARAQRRLEAWKLGRGARGLAGYVKGWFFSRDGGTHQVAIHQAEHEEIEEEEDTEEDADEEEGELRVAVEEGRRRQGLEDDERHSEDCRTEVSMGRTGLGERLSGLRITSLVDRDCGWTVWEIYVSV